MLTETRALLKTKGKSVTEVRSAILDILKSAETPLTPKQILSLITSKKPDLATVYRNLSLLESLGVINSVDLGEGFKRYEMHNPDNHKHHIICRTCGTIGDIEECGLQEIENKIFKKTGFKTEKHRLEFFGVCAVCRK